MHLASNAYVASLLMFLLGLFLGHRMTLGRERRKEFNEVALRVLVALKAVRAHASPYKTIASEADPADLILFRHLASLWTRRAFEAAVRQYEHAKSRTTRDALGQVFYENQTQVESTVDKAIACIKLR